MTSTSQLQNNTRDDLVKVVRELLSGKCSEARTEKLEAVLENNFQHPNWLDLLHYPGLSFRMRSPEEIVDLALNYVPPRMENSLYGKLVELARNYRDRFAPEKDHRFVFDPVGLLFPEVIRKGSYWCDPENSVEFAFTGGDGTHYCFLLRDNTVHDDSPVLLCCPDDYPQRWSIVGENLYDFLCFGMHCAYFNVLSVLDYPDDKPNGWYGDDTWEERRSILAYLRKELDLQPWTNRKARFQDLQNRYLHLFKMPPEE